MVQRRSKGRFQNFLFAVLVLCGLLSGGCAASNARHFAARMTAEGGFAPVQLATSRFTLSGLLRQRTSDTLHVYIEGDGFAWKSRRQPSADPTPRDTVTLRLAQGDTSGASVLYLARPGQYPEGFAPAGTTRSAPERVPTRYWTSARFAPEVVKSLGEAIDTAKAATNAQHVRLTGFSGGGALAVLVAARRDDVVLLETVAAVLDHESWTRHHQVNPLRESLNPLEAAPLLRALPQRHLMSRADSVVPPSVNEAFCKSLQQPDACVIIDGLPHDGEWEKQLY